MKACKQGVSCIRLIRLLGNAGGGQHPGVRCREDAEGGFPEGGFGEKISDRLEDLRMFGPRPGSLRVGRGLLGFV